MDAAIIASGRMDDALGYREDAMTKKQPGAKQNDKRNNGSRPDEQLAPGVQEAIGRQLRNVYGRMLAEPLPDRFKKLLDELKAAKPEEKS